MSRLLILGLLLAAAPASTDPSPELQAWSDCLLAHAQVEASGSARDTAIAVAGLNLCGPEKDRYALALVRQFSSSPPREASPAARAVSQLREDQIRLTRWMLAFIRRARE